MTKRDFFVIVIKLFGLMSIVYNLFSSIPGMFSYALFDQGYKGIIWMLFVVAVIILLFVLLVFKADKVAKWLKLDAGFDDDQLNLGELKGAEMIEIGSFILGGLLIVQHVPVFLVQSYYGFKVEVSELMTIQGRDQLQWGLSAVNLVVGYLLISHRSWVAGQLNRNKAE